MYCTNGSCNEGGLPCQHLPDRESTLVRSYPKYFHLYRRSFCEETTTVSVTRLRLYTRNKTRTGVSLIPRKTIWPLTVHDRYIVLCLVKFKVKAKVDFQKLQWKFSKFEIAKHFSNKHHQKRLFNSLQNHFLRYINA